MTASPGVGLLDRRLLFVTGKGGVGKTTVAAALAVLAARHGKRTLVAEVDAKGNLADFFEVPSTGFEPRELAPGLFAMTMHTEDSLKEYLRLQLKIPLVARLGPLARTFDFVANAAPGVKEVLIVGKFLWEVRERHYDLVVVDSVASGHVIAHLAAPQGIREMVKVGLVREQTGWLLDLLGRPGRHRRRRGRQPGGDARQRDAGAPATDRQRDERRPGGGRGEPRVARAVRPRRGGGLRTAPPARRASPPSRARSAGR